MFAKLLLLILIMAILTSLGLALYYLVRSEEASERTLLALTWRTLLSIALFLLLLTAFQVGLITPHAPVFLTPTSAHHQ